MKDVTMYQETLGSYSGKMLQHRIESIVEVTWKRYFKVASRLSWWLLVTDVTMYIKSALVVSKASLRLLKTYVTGSHQERLGTYPGKMLPHSIASKALWRLLEKDFTTEHRKHCGGYLRNMLQHSIECTRGRCFKAASEGSWKWLEKDAAT